MQRNCVILITFLITIVLLRSTECHRKLRSYYTIHGDRVAIGLVDRVGCRVEWLSRVGVVHS